MTATGIIMSNIEIIVGAIITHIMFNRLEPRGAVQILVLAIAPPIMLIIGLRSTQTTVLHMIRSYVLFYAVLISSILAYRISPFHPLASYPGPFVCRLTRLWATYTTYRGFQHHYYKSLHEKYGTHVRTGPNHIHICDIDAISTIYGGRTLPRSDRYAVLNVPGTTGSVIGIIDPQEHMVRRRIWNHGLSVSSVQNYEVYLRKRISQLLLKLEKKTSVDLSSWLSFFSFDFMGDLAFGGAFKLVENEGDTHGYIKVMHMAMKYQETLGTIPWMRAFINYLPGLATVDEAHKFSEDSILARKSQGSSYKDIFYYLLDEEGVGEGPPPLPQLIMEAELAIQAGSDTTGTALTNLFYYLMSNPETYRRLRKEVDDAFPPGSEIDTKIVSELKYLQAVINETLRLQPAVPCGGPRVIPKGSQGTIIAGKFIPPESTVQITTYALHRDQRYYENPEVFWPERWLTEDAKQREIMNTAHIPFSYGPTQCAGKYLAILEMRMVICSLIQKFEFSFDKNWDSTKWESSLTDYFTLIKNQPLPVTIKLRT